MLRRVGAVPPLEDTWTGDRAPLAQPEQRGRRQAPETGRWLNANIDRLDLAVVSPAVRARSTWELVSSEQDVAPPTRTDVRVYGATGSELLSVVRDVSDDFGTVVLVGHNPGFERLAEGFGAYDLIGLQTEADVANLIDFLANGVGGKANLDFGRPVRTQYLVVWLTSLPPADGAYRGRVSEIVVRR